MIVFLLIVIILLLLGLGPLIGTALAVIGLLMVFAMDPGFAKVVGAFGLGILGLGAAIGVIALLYAVSRFLSKRKNGSASIEPSSQRKLSPAERRAISLGDRANLLNLSVRLNRSLYRSMGGEFLVVGKDGFLRAYKTEHDARQYLAFEKEYSSNKVAISSTVPDAPNSDQSE